MTTHTATNIYAVSGGGLSSIGQNSTGIVQFSVDSGIVALRSWAAGEISSNTLYI
jgi:hypothetical protein